MVLEGAPSDAAPRVPTEGSPDRAAVARLMSGNERED
jgi:hypothetical protein